MSNMSQQKTSIRILKFVFFLPGTLIILMTYCIFLIVISPVVYITAAFKRLDNCNHPDG